MADHQWELTGITIDTAPDFSEERCAKCGAINWGGSRTNRWVPLECHENREAYRKWYKQKQNEIRTLAEVV